MLSLIRPFFPNTALPLNSDYSHLWDSCGILAAQEHNLDPNMAGSCGKNPLHWACVLGDANMADALLSRGARVDLSDRGGQTPLMTAAQHGHLHVIVSLVNARAYLDEADNKGRTALTQAASRGHEDVVRLLLLYGSDPSRVDMNGQTALDIARLGQHGSVYELLDQACLNWRRTSCRIENNGLVDYVEASEGSGMSEDAVSDMFNKLL